MLPKRVMPMLLAAGLWVVAIPPLEARGLPRHVPWPGAVSGRPLCIADGCVRTYQSRGTHFHLRPDGQEIRYGDGLIVTAARVNTHVRMNGRLVAVLPAGGEWLITPGYRPIDVETSSPVEMALVRSAEVAGLACAARKTSELALSLP